MYHGITFEEASSIDQERTDTKKKHTWTDWHLIPASRPHFVPPALKTNFVDIPGSNGSLDLSTVLTDGEPCYEHREGSFDFIVDPEYRPWFDIYSQIANYLGGREFKATLDDDPEWFYRGRFMVSDWKTDANYSTITIQYIVDPFKWKQLKTTSDRWKWNPFNLYNGVISNKIWHERFINSEEFVEVDFGPYMQYGFPPVTPTVFATEILPYQNIEIKYFTNGGGTITLTDISKAVHRSEFVLSPLNSKIEVRGHGKYSLQFREGML